MTIDVDACATFTEANKLPSLYHFSLYFDVHFARAAGHDALHEYRRRQLQTSLAFLVAPGRSTCRHYGTTAIDSR